MTTEAETILAELAEIRRDLEKPRLPKMLPRKQAIAYLGCSAHFFQRLIYAGWLERAKNTGTKEARYLVSDLDRALKKSQREELP